MRTCSARGLLCPWRAGESRERGSWDDGWFNPRGAFDWSAVDRFEIVAEHHDFTGMQFWFDDIRVTSPLRTR